jgi:hypothetical protein
MPANLPNFSNLHAMGQQFKTNVFQKIASGATRSSVSLGRQARTATKPVQMPQQPQKTFSPAGPNDAPLSADAVQEGRARRQAKAANFQPPGAPGHAQPNFSAANVAKGHNLERGTGLSAPVSTHAAPKFVSLKQASVGSPSFSDAGTDTPRPANVFKSSMTHATPAFSDVNTMQQSPASKTPVSTNPFQPHNISQQQFPKQQRGNFVDTSTKSNSPFPTHVHPANSSNLELSNLSAAHSSPGKPQQFTVGSRNIKGGGIASMGSQLEEGLATRPLSLPSKRKRT